MALGDKNGEKKTPRRRDTFIKRLKGEDDCKERVREGSSIKEKRERNEK